MKKVLTFILVSFLLISCGNQSDQDSEENSYKKLFIDIDNIKSNYSFHSDNYELIPLELNDQSLIGAIDKLIHYQNRIFILDTDITKSIFCFSEVGEFLYKINSVGEGVGEFVKPFDVYLFNEEIQVLDANQRKTIVFDMKGGFKRETRLPFEDQIMRLYPIDNDCIAYHLDGRSHGSGSLELIKVFNKEFNSFTAKGVVETGNTDAYKSPIEFSENSGVVRFLHPWTDTIYNISKNKINTDYVLDFGPDRLKKETKQLFLTEMREYFMKNPYVFNAGNLVETNDYLSFQWVRSKQGYEISEDETFVSYFNKTSGELANFPILGNWKNGTSLNGPVFGSEAYFFGFITYGDWLKLSDSGPRKRFTDEGNPIIVKYEIDI